MKRPVVLDTIAIRPDITLDVVLRCRGDAGIPDAMTIFWWSAVPEDKVVGILPITQLLVTDIMA